MLEATHPHHVCVGSVTHQRRPLARRPGPRGEARGNPLADEAPRASHIGLSPRRHQGGGGAAWAATGVCRASRQTTRAHACGRHGRPVWEQAHGRRRMDVPAWPRAKRVARMRALVAACARCLPRAPFSPAAGAPPVRRACHARCALCVRARLTPALRVCGAACCMPRARACVVSRPRQVRPSLRSPAGGAARRWCAPASRSARCVRRGSPRARAARQPAPCSPRPSSSFLLKQSTHAPAALLMGAGARPATAISASLYAGRHGRLAGGGVGRVDGGRRRIWRPRHGRGDAAAGHGLGFAPSGATGGARGALRLPCGAWVVVRGGAARTAAPAALRRHAEARPMSCR